MVFTENEIKSLRWRNELNRILKSPEPNNSERLFLCCFCKDQLNWSEEKTINFILYYAQWKKNFSRHGTTRQVNMVYENKNLGSMVSRSHSSCSQIKVSSETRHTGNTAGGETVNIETRRYAAEETVKNDSLSPDVFQVSPFDRIQTWKDLRIPEEKNETMEERKKPLETKQVFGTVNNGTKFYRVVEKVGEKGNFISMESGFMVDAITANGEQVNAFGRPDKYFSLPQNKDDLNELIEILKKVNDGGATKKHK